MAIDVVADDDGQRPSASRAASASNRSSLITVYQL